MPFGIRKSKKIGNTIHNILFEDENVDDQRISNLDPEAAYDFAVDKKVNDEKIPKQLETIISRDSEYSYRYAKDILHYKNVPDIIVDSISKSAQLSVNYAEMCLGYNYPVPEKIIDGIAKKVGPSWYYADKILHWQDTPPKILETIFNDADWSYRYATQILRGKNVPQRVIDSISKDMQVSISYASFVQFTDVPQEIINTISKNEDYSYYYAEQLPDAPNNVPSEIINTISENTKLAFAYADQVLAWKNVPEPILNSIKNDQDYTYRYAEKALKWENVPEEIVNNIIENIHDNDHIYIDFNFVEELPNKNEIINRLKDSKNFVKYYLTPKKLAEQYNNQMSGFIMHATDYWGLYKLANMQIQDNWGEICVATLDSDVIPLNRNICLLGQTDIRLLFDFDCYSRIAEEDKKRRRYATRAEDVDLEKSKRERLESSVDGGEFMDSKYYDEGFAQAKDINWLAYVDVNDEYENTDDEYLKQLKRITKAEFDELLKSGQIIKYLYDLLHKDDDTHKDEYSDIEDELLVKESIVEPSIDDLQTKIHNILLGNNNA